MKRQLIKWSVLVVVIGAVAVGDYVLGTLHPAVHVSTGTAYSNGGNQSVGGSVIPGFASVKVDGWWYGIEGGVSEWEDADGSWHDGSTWPTCLSPLGDHQIRFGWVSVSTPSSLGWREVVWVECP